MVAKEETFHTGTALWGLCWKVGRYERKQQRRSGNACIHRHELIIFWSCFAALWLFGFDLRFHDPWLVDFVMTYMDCTAGHFSSSVFPVDYVLHGVMMMENAETDYYLVCRI